MTDTKTSPAKRNCDGQPSLAPAPLLGCWWIFDESTWSYDTICGNKFQFTNDGVIQNGFKFCPYCGKPILQPADLELREAREEWHDDDITKNDVICHECELIGKPNCPEHGGEAA